MNGGMGRRLSRRTLLTGVAAATFGGASRVTRSRQGLDRFWEVTSSPAADPAIEAYAFPASVSRGQPLHLHVASRYRRLSGLAARVGRTGLEPAQVFDVTTSGSMTSVKIETGMFAAGLYLVALRPADGSDHVRFVPVTVRDDRNPASVIVHIPTATYQAYNAWGGASLYDFDSPGGAAEHVGMDRPYDAFDGAGFCFYGDYQMASWLDAEGVRADFIMSNDLHVSPSALRGRTLFVSAFHDEYWSQEMRNNLHRFIGSGGNAAFLGANNIYARITFDADGRTLSTAPKGTPRRFRDLGQPEDELLGSWYDAYRFPYGSGAAWEARNTNHWIYNGTGMNDGDRIDGLIGYEWDHARTENRSPHVTLLSETQVAPGRRHNGVVFNVPGRGTVVNVGTTYWPRFLTGTGTFPTDQRVITMTRNILTNLS